MGVCAGLSVPLGYGFVREDGNSKEIFVHQSSIQVPGVKDLRPGQRILFEYCRTAKGEIALNVIPIMEREDALERYHAKHNCSAGALPQTPPKD